MSLQSYVKMGLHYSREMRPHLVDGAAELIERHLTKDSRVLEIGAGSSTIWFAERAGSVLSFEHSLDYFNTVAVEIGARDIKNVQLHLAQRYPTSSRADLPQFNIDSRFDMILIDGRNRVRCVLAYHWRLAAGGLLVLDDSQRPKYEQAINFLDGLGWERRDFSIDIKNDYGYYPRTTIWRKPKC